MILDMHEVEIKVGSDVLVHQEEETRKAVVVELFPDAPTINEEGSWVVEFSRKYQPSLPSIRHVIRDDLKELFG